MNTNIKNKAKWFLYSYIWLGVFMLLIDIVTKNIIVNTMKVGQSIDLIPGFLRITYQVNTNFAFSSSFNMPPDVVRIVFCIVATIGIGIILFIYIKKNKTLPKVTKAALMLLLVGALGNLIDRVAYTPEYLGYKFNGVVDWIDFCGIWKFVFNWADSCLVVGALMLIIYYIVIEIVASYKKKKAADKLVTGKVLSKDEQAKEDQFKKIEDNNGKQKDNSDGTR